MENAENQPFQFNFNCILCTDPPYGTDHAGALRRHMKTVHSDQKDFVCSTCGKEFKIQYNLTLHVRTHGSDKPFACDVCQKRFKTSDSLIKHKKIHDTAKRFSCSTCNEYATNDRSNYNKHVNKCTGSKATKLKVSSKEISDLSPSQPKKRHISPESPEFKCRPCNMTFDNKSHLQQHRVDKHPLYRCEFCGQNFRLAHLYRKHIHQHIDPKFASEELKKLKRMYNEYLKTIEEWDVITKTRKEVSDVIRKFYMSALIINDAIGKENRELTFEIHVGISQEGFDDLVSSDDYFQDIADEFKKEIMKDQQIFTWKDFQETYGGYCGSSSVVLVRMWQHYCALHRPVQRNIYLHRNIAGEKLSVHLPFPALQCPLIERMMKVIFAQREKFYISPNSSDLAFDQMQFIMDGMADVYLVFFNKKYMLIMNVQLCTRRYLQKNDQMNEDDARELAAERYGTKTVRGQVKFKVPIDRETEMSELSKDLAEWIEEVVHRGHNDYMKTPYHQLKSLIPCVKLPKSKI